MADKARNWTDKKLNSMEKRIKGIYKDAQGEITEKWNKYMAEGENRLKSLRDAFISASPEDRAKAKEAYEHAVRNYTLNNARYKELVDETTLRLANVNQIALSYVNDQIPDIYAKNYAQVGEDLKKAGIDFKGKNGSSIRQIVNEDTVKKMIKEGDVKTPFMRTKKFLNIPKDQRWNTKKINSQVLQGILQGESMNKIADRLLPIVNSNSSASIRNARTLVTGAENGGRNDSYHRLEDEGVVMKKVWIATGDDRTRESHLVMDGQEVDIDEDFEDGDGNYLAYPADPSGEPETVYNCRCSMRTHIVGFRRADGSIVEVDYEDKGGESAHERSIREEQERRGIEPKVTVPEPEPSPEQREPVSIEKLKNVMAEDDYNKFVEMATNADSYDLWNKYGSEVKTIQLSATDGYYQPFADKVVFSYEEKHEGMNKYSTLAHEMNHAFDNKIGANSNLSFQEAEKINNACQFGTGRFKMVNVSPSSSDEFLNALREDMNNLKSKGLGSVYTELRATNELRNATSGIQDALDGFFSTQKTFSGWGHGDRYYNRGYNHKVVGLGQEKNLKNALNELGFDASNQAKVKQIFRQYESASEAWANVGGAVTVGGAELDAITKYMPNTLEAYKNIVKGVMK